MAWTNSHAASLNGSNQYFSVTNGGTYNLTAGTVEIWFKMNTLPGAGSSYELVSTITAPGTSGFTLNINGDTNTLQANVQGSGGTAGTVLSAGVWYHGALAWNASSLTMFLNGVADGTFSCSSPSTAQDLLIGLQNVGVLRYYFNGLLDEVRVWNKKRTGAEILADFRSQLVGTETNLLSYWKLDNALTDSTSGARTLTNNNAATFTTSSAFTANTLAEVLGVPLEVLTLDISWDISIGDVLGVPLETITVTDEWKEETKPSNVNWNQQSKP